MSSEDIDKHDGTEDVDFGEGEDFDEPPPEGAPEEDTQTKDEAAVAVDDNPDAPAEVPSAEGIATEAAGGATEEAVLGDAPMGEPAENAVANGDGTTDAAATGDGEEAAVSKSAAVNKMGGGADPLEEPPHGSEVFVGGIPKTSTVTDEQLLEFAQAGGEVYSCAVLTDPGTGQNRGYGFIKFKSKEIAQEAMTKLNDTQMKDHPGVKIRVLPSQSKNRLYLGNLPKEKSKDELQALLKSATKGLESVELLMSKDWPGQNRGFCFLEFYNHACAQAAKAALSPPHFQLGNKPLTITFAEPRRADTSPDQSQEIKSIFVGNLPDSANEAKLRELFAPLGEITRAFIPAPRDGKKRREFGFVHFQDRSSVVQAIANHDRGEKLLLDGTPLEVKMGRVYHETPPQRLQQSGLQQGSYGRGMGNMGMSMGAGRFGGGHAAGYQQQQAGPMGGVYGMTANYGGDYGQYSGAMTGMAGGYGGQMMDGGYGGMGGGEEYYDSSYGSYGGGMGALGATGGMGAAGGAGMAMVPMMLPNGQIGYVLSNAGAAGGMAAGGAAAGVGAMAGAGMGMGGPMRGRTGYGNAAGSAAGNYGGMGRGRAGGGYGGGTGQQRYTPY